PGAAGRGRTTPAASSPWTWCTTVPWMRGTRKKFFFASSTPLEIAAGTSLALPWPTPTVPSPSPTTTRAVKENRRPPLTTFDTRLMLTTRSRNADFSASCPRPRPPWRPPRPPPWRPRSLLLLELSSRRPEAAGPLFRCCAAIFRSSSRPVSGRRSQRQAGLASAVGDGGHATVVLVAAAVEHDGVDPGGLRTLADQGPDGAGLVRLAAVRAAQVRLHGRGRRD